MFINLEFTLQSTMAAFCVFKTDLPSAKQVNANSSVTILRVLPLGCVDNGKEVMVSVMFSFGNTEHNAIFSWLFILKSHMVCLNVS